MCIYVRLMADGALATAAAAAAAARTFAAVAGSSALVTHTRRRCTLRPRRANPFYGATLVR